MTFTGRIRTSLVLVAVVPTLLVMTAIYLLGQRQAARADRVAAQRAVQRFEQYRLTIEDELRDAARSLAASPEISRARVLLAAGRSAEVRLDALPSGLDFLEITDRTRTVLASHHRPGLVGEQLDSRIPGPAASDITAAVERDVDGAHPSLSGLFPIDTVYRIYAGRYLDSTFARTAEQLIGARIRIALDSDAPASFANMTGGQLYTDRDSLRAVLFGGADAGYYVAASFGAGPDSSIFGNLLIITAIVALISVATAVALGMIIASRTKREFDNLISATARVSSGDFSTPVMAFDEGEFAQLADSFTEMTFRLRETQRRLATSEKIAAWQAVGRKIAHEIKNPLTPIAISTDDLRRSYDERLDNFPAILHETTATIKSEVARLTRLLDEFVRFARMSPPIFRDVPPQEILTPIESLYRGEIDTRRLSIANRSSRVTVNFDPDALRQVLVNLIKNGLEAAPDSCVSVTITDEPGVIVITVADSGPGFSSDILTRGFEPYVSTKRGGSGLGLVISQRIVYDHGGTIELSNRPESGAQVTIKLPVSHG